VKQQTTTNLYDPYVLGYIRVTMVFTKRNNFFG